MWMLFRSLKEDRGNLAVNIMLGIFYSWLILLPLGLWKIIDLLLLFF
jgi:hypothetical protein